MAQPHRAAEPQRFDTEDEKEARGLVARAFTLVEDVVYIGLGLLLAISAVVLLVNTALAFSHDLLQGALPAATIALLDRLLLVLMIVELLYTVQVSFREHTLVPQPFLVVGLVAATRRVLVLTAEFTGAQAPSGEAFRIAMIELALLTVMIVALVGCLRLLAGGSANAVARRA